MLEIMYLLVFALFFPFFSFRYSSTERADIGRYTCQHGTATADRYFSRKFNKNVSENTASTINKEYNRGKRKLRDNDVPALPKHASPLLLGTTLDEKVQLPLIKVRESGEVISSRIAMAAAAKGTILELCSLN